MSHPHPRLRMRDTSRSPLSCTEIPSQMSCCAMAHPDEQGGIRSQDVSESVCASVLGVALSLGIRSEIDRKTTAKNPRSRGSPYPTTLGAKQGTHTPRQEKVRDGTYW